MVKANGYWFVEPDNGLFDWVIKSAEDVLILRYLDVESRIRRVLGPESMLVYDGPLTFVI